MPDPLHLAFLLFPGLTPLDLIGPAQTLSRLGDARLDYVAKTLGPVASDVGVALIPTATLADIASANVLVVPGALGTTAVIEDDETGPARSGG